MDADQIADAIWAIIIEQPEPVQDAIEGIIGRLVMYIED